MKVDKTFAASVALHVLVIGWGLVSFSSKAFVSVPEESLPVEIISADQLAHVTKGMRTGQKNVPKPLVEKVAEAKPPAEDTVGKIDDKKPPVVTDMSPPPQPKPDDKAAAEAAAKAAEAKAQADAKAKAEAQAKAAAQARAKAEAKAKSDADAKARAEAQAKAEAKRAERTFDQTKIAALLDKRDPTRQSVTGDTLNSNAALGLAHGKSADNSATWGAMFKSQVERCWKKPYGGIEAQTTEAIFSVRLKRDGSLEATPASVSSPSTPYFRVYQESALRAIIDCQPYKLPAAFFDEWKFFEPVFTEKRS